MEKQELTRRNISLPKGGILEVDLTPQFLDVVCKHFDLSSTRSVSDDHIRIYFWGAFKNAIEKAEGTV